VGRIEMSCMTPVKAGQRVQVAEPEADKFRAHVIEWLMLNHPHDCAVCEEGGACHLQDMTVKTGHHTRRFDGAKRSHAAQDLGPFLTHRMNRCIACYRCTRFYRDYAGGSDFDAFGAHDRVWFGRAEPGPLESPFAGNLSEVCPTGVFADRHWSRHYARRWDMTATPAICGQCSVGCNLTVFERHGTLRLVQNRYHGAINGFFLCDRGRYGALAADGDLRLNATRHHGAPIATRAAFDLVRVARAPIGIGSPRASLEANLALRRLVGPARFFAGVSDAEAALEQRIAAILRAGPARIATIKEIETADAALVLGEDLTGTAPRAALALRQAARGAERALAREKGVPEWLDPAVRVAGEGRRSPVILATPLPDALDDVAMLALRLSPTDIAAFGHAVAAALRGDPPRDAHVAATAEALAAAEAPVIVAGAGLGFAGPAEAAAAIAAALGARARIALFPPEANSLGLALMGGAGLDSARALMEAAPAPLIVLENDLFARADPATVEALLAAAPMTVALDWLETGTTARADLVVPVASPTEASGTFVNHEGRAQRSLAARPPAADVPAAWRVLSAIGGGLFRGGEERLDDVLAALAADCPPLAGARDAAPDPATLPRPAARASEGFSGRTSDNRAGREAPPAADPDSGMGWTMEGLRDARSTALATAPLRPGLNSVSAAYAAQSTIGGPLKGGDPGVALLTPGDASDAGVPLADPPLAGEGLAILPLHDPFAATETDRASPLLAARAPGPRVVLHPEDAAALGLAAGAAVTLDGRPAPAPLTLDPSLPRGHVGISNARGPARAVRIGGAP
jgi:NADH-quinone oxidoreductase subunit G